MSNSFILFTADLDSLGNRRQNLSHNFFFLNTTSMLHQLLSPAILSHQNSDLTNSILGFLLNKTLLLF